MTCGHFCLQYFNTGFPRVRSDWSRNQIDSGIAVPLDGVPPLGIIPVLIGCADMVNHRRQTFIDGYECLAADMAEKIRISGKIGWAGVDNLAVMSFTERHKPRRPVQRQVVYGERRSHHPPAALTASCANSNGDSFSASARSYRTLGTQMSHLVDRASMISG